MHLAHFRSPGQAVINASPDVGASARRRRRRRRREHGKGDESAAQGGRGE